MRSPSFTVSFDCCETTHDYRHHFIIFRNTSNGPPFPSVPSPSSSLCFIYTWTENLALGKPAAQSSTYGDVHSIGEAGKAVDGIPDAYFNHGHCSHTAPNNPSWWRVDLGPNRVPVSDVFIVNRFSTDPNVRLRSKDYKITLGKYFQNGLLV